MPNIMTNGKLGRTACSSVDLTDEFVSALCWLAFLLTENWDIRLALVCSVFDPDDLPDASSGRLARCKSRRLVAGAAIAALGVELKRSAIRAGGQDDVRAS
jgi:hypothetical protein